MSRELHLALAGLGVLVSISVVHAQLETPVSIERTVEAEWTACEGGICSGGLISDAGNGVAPFDSTVSSADASPRSPFSPYSTASQNSAVIPDIIFAAGSVDAYGYPQGAGITLIGSARSLFTETFDLTQSYTYSLSGSLSSNYWGTAQVSLADSVGTRVFSEEAWGFAIAKPLDDSGILLPGRYTFSASAEAQDADELHRLAAFDLQFSITPVPEPTTAGLLILGSAAWLRRRRKAGT